MLETERELTSRLQGASKAAESGMRYAVVVGMKSIDGHRCRHAFSTGTEACRKGMDPVDVEQWWFAGSVFGPSLQELCSLVFWAP